MNRYVVIARDDIASLINTLTQIDVRGFPSMDRLVSSVAFLENALKQDQAAPKTPAEAPNEKGGAD